MRVLFATTALPEGREETLVLSALSAAWPTPCRRWRNLAWPATTGFLFGYIALHPLSMVVFQWLDPRLATGNFHGQGGSWWGPITHSFHRGMLPMGIVFGVIGASIATFYACFRLTLMAQRDRLAEQAEMLKRNNQELARLELANRRTSQFMAHDFKTSLGCVAGFAAQLLQRPELKDNHDVANALVCIRRQAHGMLGSVADLLEFARVREHREPRIKPVDVAELLQETVRDFSLPAHTERIKLGDQYRRCPPLLADARSLRRVLCNLISNAIKHNGPATEVRLDARVAEPGTEVLFSCCDDGAGIPAERLPSIFTEFAGSDNTSSDSTGLGLAFCKAVVQAHGGGIWYESTPGQGTCFFFTVPFPKETDHEQ